MGRGGASGVSSETGFAAPLPRGDAEVAKQGSRQTGNGSAGLTTRRKPESGARPRGGLPGRLTPARWSSAVQTGHRWVGIATVAAFLGTGWVLRLHDPPMASLAPRPRMLLRSGHIYILFAGLLNLALGMAGGRPVPPGRDRIRSWLAAAGSGLVVASAVQLIVGFFVESGSGMLYRPLTACGIFEALGGTLLHVLAWRGGVG
jgi:hypothetical protein